MDNGQETTDRFYPGDILCCALRIIARAWCIVQTVCISHRYHVSCVNSLDHGSVANVSCHTAADLSAWHGRHHALSRSHGEHRSRDHDVHHGIIRDYCCYGEQHPAAADDLVYIEAIWKACSIAGHQSWLADHPVFSLHVQPCNMHTLYVHNQHHVPQGHRKHPAVHDACDSRMRRHWWLYVPGWNAGQYAVA